MYEIAPNRGWTIDVNRTFGANSPFPTQMEIAFKGGIPTTWIKGAWTLDGKFTPNPNFVP